MVSGPGARRPEGPQRRRTSSSVDSPSVSRWHAILFLDIGGAVLKVDSRPSDAIALALRAKVPILVEDRVFEKAERVSPKPSPSPHF